MIPPRPRILYIDDDEALRRLAVRTLERRGYAVTTAGDGAEGVRLAGEGGFDLVAVDHYMPGQDGLTTLGQLMALPAPPPVIYVTGSDESRIAVAALKAGAADYVVKTVGEDFLALLGSAIDQALDQVRLRRDKDRAEEALRASNARLQAMLREVNHRVANSLQLVSTFVHLQAQAAEEGARMALNDTKRRIEAIMHVHRKLYTSEDVETVDLGDYLASLMRDLEETWSTPASPRRFRLEAEPVHLQTDKAVSLGVIVNELASNACKYAYAPEQAGEVRVHLARTPSGALRLVVEDDGRGLAGEGPPQGTGIGSKLIKAMAAGLRSAVVYDSSGQGLKASLEFAP